MSAPKQFHRKPHSVLAMQFDGTDDSAMEIQSWTNGRVKPSKPWKRNYGCMDFVDQVLLDGDWVIMREGEVSIANGPSSVHAFPERETFSDAYEPAPGAVSGHPGGAE